MALAAQRCAESASAELAQACTQQAAAEQQVAKLEQRLADEITVREDRERCASRKHSNTGLRSIVRWALFSWPKNVHMEMRSSTERCLPLKVYCLSQEICSSNIGKEISEWMVPPADMI